MIAVCTSKMSQMPEVIFCSVVQIISELLRQLIFRYFSQEAEPLRSLSTMASKNRKPVSGVVEFPSIIQSNPLLFRLERFQVIDLSTNNGKGFGVTGNFGLNAS